MPLLPQLSWAWNQRYPPRYGERGVLPIVITYLVESHIKSYIYPDEEYDLTVPFGWELNSEEEVVYTVTHQGGLSDPLSLSFQPWRLLDEYRVFKSAKRER